MIEKKKKKPFEQDISESAKVIINDGK